ncbi:hypothetical protein [Lactobacillus gallinarum]|uniref:hypothetical protein n=1 Tax=Lactobacillus gallinarum TaxID=52242 RepID=UPI00248E4783|nr:hypothetical protein [Lactobacillus gallinarum]
MPKLTVKPNLQAYVETRAQEVVNKFSHIRPNGKRTAYEENIGRWLATPPQLLV